MRVCDSVVARAFEVLAMVHSMDQPEHTLDLDLTCQMPAASSYHEIWDAMQKRTRDGYG